MIKIVPAETLAATAQQIIKKRRSHKNLASKTLNQVDDSVNNTTQESNNNFVYESLEESLKATLLLFSKAVPTLEVFLGSNKLKSLQSNVLSNTLLKTNNKKTISSQTVKNAMEGPNIRK